VFVQNVKPTHNITYNSSLHFRQIQITPEELLIQIGDFGQAISKLSNKNLFAAETIQQAALKK
jgi:hypothetical protein